MTSSFSSNSGSSSGSGSSATPSRSAHGSFSISPKRNKKFKTSQNPSDKQAGPSTLEKFQDRLTRNPWEGVVSSARTPIEKIRAKYFIPPEYKIRIPRTFDRMHRPPSGFCAFSVKHFDTRLRFPLAPPLARILNKLELCPMQLFSNSIFHIVLFIIIMQYLDLEPSFDNFWSLYSFTTCKRSAERGFFDLSAKPHCGYLEPLKSNVGACLDRYIFVRPPRVWPFTIEWTKYKPIPRMSGGGLEGDQINSLTVYKYDPKKLLTENVLQLSGLSPASIHIAESLGSLIMSTRNAMRLKAAQNKLKKGKQVDSEETPPLPLHGYNSSDLDLNLDDLSEVQGEETTERPDCDSGEKSKKRKRISGAKPLSRMARDAAEKADQPDKRDRFQRLERLSACWEQMHAELKGDRAQSAQPPELKGDLCLEFLAWGGFLGVVRGGHSPTRPSFNSYQHSLQWGNFLRSLSMRCMSYRWNHMVSEKKVKDLSTELERRDAVDLRHLDEMLALSEKVKELEGRLAEADKAKEVAVAEGKKERFDTGREVGLVEGHKQGLEEGQAGRITVEEHHQALADSRMSAVRDFLKTDTFTTALEIKSADSFTKGYETYQAQIAKLGGFQESFDRGQLDITLDGDLQPYPAEPDLKDDEFMSLRDELEAEADA
ncbi:UNVERIFIED_CONTAM: hypothetical protein Sindi_2896200 [Sesamum indicum]